MLHRNYFRTEVHGAENVPTGRVLLVANHSGQIPIDGALIGAAMFMDAEPPRFIRAMVEKWAVSLPFVSLLFSRVGQVVGVPENATRLARRRARRSSSSPKGRAASRRRSTSATSSPSSASASCASRSRPDTPIVPVAVIGGEEQYVSVANVEALAKLLRMPAFPVIPQLLLPGGQLPLPTKYRIYFGEPMPSPATPTTTTPSSKRRCGS